MTAPPAAAPTRSPGWQIGRLAGVPVYLGRSWFVVAVVIIGLFGPVAADVLPSLGGWAYAIAGVFAILLLVSVLVHEAAHALVGRACGYQVARIVADFWGGHTAYDSRDATPGRSALVAIAGPLANAALAGIGWLGLQVVDRGVIFLLLAGFTYSNAFVAAFNLLPGLPLDGGFLVDSAVWKATGSRAMGMLVAGWCGRLVTLALVWWAIGVPLMSGDRPSLTRLIYAVLIGSFLWVGASESVQVGRARRRLEKVTVSQVARVARVVPVGTPLAQVLPATPTPAREQPVLVVADLSGRALGLLDPTAGARVPPELLWTTPVEAVLRRLPEGWVVTADLDDPLTDVVVAMQTLRVPAIALAGRQDGRVHGVVLAADL